MDVDAIFFTSVIMKTLLWAIAAADSKTKFQPYYEIIRIIIELNDSRRCREPRMDMVPAILLLTITAPNGLIIMSAPVSIATPPHRSSH
jgi:hypothetical protein